MKVTNIDILKNVEKSITEVIRLFQQNSYDFLYESDIQAILFAQLRQLLPYQIKIMGTGKPLNEYSLSIVNTEYSKTVNKYRKKIDIVCFNAEIERPNTRVHKNHDMNMFDMPILIGIELKYRKQGDNFTISSCIDDLNSLKNVTIPTPIIIGFIQNENALVNFMNVENIRLEQKRITTNDLPKYMSDCEDKILVISPESIILIKNIKEY